MTVVLTLPSTQSLHQDMHGLKPIVSILQWNPYSLQIFLGFSMKFSGQRLGFLCLGLMALGLALGCSVSRHSWVTDIRWQSFFCWSLCPSLLLTTTEPQFSLGLVICPSCPLILDKNEDGIWLWSMRYKWRRPGVFPRFQKNSVKGADSDSLFLLLFAIPPSSYLKHGCDGWSPSTLHANMSMKMIERKSKQNLGSSWFGELPYQPWPVLLWFLITREKKLQVLLLSIMASPGAQCEVSSQA